MLKTPFEFIKDIYKEKIERDRKTNEFIYTQTDGLITWIIGFAFTGLLLLIANLRNLDLPKKSPTKPVVICLLLTIVLGLAFRYVSFLIMMFEKGLDDYYAGVFGQYEMSPISADEELDNLNFDQILLRLKKDFEEVIEYQNPISEELKKIELPRLKEHYKSLCDHSKKSADIAMNHIAEIEYTSHRVSKEENLTNYKNAIDNPQIGYNAAIWSQLRSWLFTLCLFAFLLAVSIVGISLLFI